MDLIWTNPEVFPSFSDFQCDLVWAKKCILWLSIMLLTVYSKSLKWLVAEKKFMCCLRRYLLHCAKVAMSMKNYCTTFINENQVLKRFLVVVNSCPIDPYQCLMGGALHISSCTPGGIQPRLSIPSDLDFTQAHRYYIITSAWCMPGHWYLPHQQLSLLPWVNALHFQRRK